MWDKWELHYGVVSWEYSPIIMINFRESGSGRDGGGVELSGIDLPGG